MTAAARLTSSGVCLGACLHSPDVRLLAEVLKCYLNTLVIHLLKLISELIAALGGSREELDNVSDGRAWFTFDLCGRTHVDETVKIVIGYVVVQSADIDAAGGLIAYAQHLRAVADWRNVFIAPPPLLEPNTASGRPIAVEPYAFGLCAVPGEVFGEWHLDGGHEVYDLAHIFSLCCARGGKDSQKETREKKIPNGLWH